MGSGGPLWKYRFIHKLILSRFMLRLQLPYLNAHNIPFLLFFKSGFEKLRKMDYFIYHTA